MLSSKWNLALAIALLFAGAALSYGQNAQPSSKEQEAKLIAVLKSDAAQKEKADACRELSHVGTKDAVPALVALLGDEKMSHMARYGLETIPDASVDEALRAALGKLKGRLLVGVIGSIGVRKDAKAVDALAKFIKDSDADVAQAAARALGKIGDSAAAKALDGALAGVPAANQLAVCEGMFRCAEALAAKGQKDEALAIYDKLRALKDALQQVRAGALRGAIITRQKEGIPMLLEALRGDDWVLVAAAVRASQEMPGAEVTKALADELAKSSADKQTLLLQNLGARADAAAVPAVSALAKSGAGPIRIAAIRTLTQIASPSALPLIVELLKAPEADVAAAAQTSLAAFPGKEADAAVVSLMDQQDAKIRAMAIEMIGSRRIASAVPALLKAAEDADEAIRVASLKVLGDLAGAPELPGMLNLLMKGKSAKEMKSAEDALSAICARQANADACADKVLAVYSQAQGAQKLACLRVLRSIGGAKALSAARAAASDSNAEIKDTALRILCEWPSPDALPDVTQLAKTSADPKIKILALRGCFTLIPLQQVPDEKKIAAIKEVMALTERTEEKRLALAALGAIQTADSLALIAPFLTEPGLKAEAAIAAVAIAEKIVESHPAEVAAAMAKVDTGNLKLAKRAKDLANQAKKASPKK
ncbi:MAG: HEAT repeat domain-containing protein [Candidatus Sumerlaeota bacterium]|nr:HEAT repeat domain-containing protein [Candidatus Sumerlaeota bacterium]